MSCVALRDQHPFELQAVHVHHGLSPHADDWADFCARLCASHAVELSIHRVRIARDDAAGIEAAARRERQRIFAALDADFLLTAHQQDDQAETLLLQLLRGAGPKGLAAMAELQHRPGWRAAQLRPLLGVTRARIAGVCAAARPGLGRRREQSGHPLPPQCAAPAGDAAAGCAFSRQPAPPSRARPRCRPMPPNCSTIWRGWMPADAIAGERLDCAALAGLSLPRARNLLRHFIEQHGQPMPSAAAARTRRCISCGMRRRDARVCVRLGALELWRFRGGAYLVPHHRRRPRRFAGRARRRCGCRLPGSACTWRR